MHTQAKSDRKRQRNSATTNATKNHEHEHQPPTGKPSSDSSKRPGTSDTQKVEDCVEKKKNVLRKEYLPKNQSWGWCEPVLGTAPLVQHVFRQTALTPSLSQWVRAISLRPEASVSSIAAGPALCPCEEWRLRHSPLVVAGSSDDSAR